MNSTASRVMPNRESIDSSTTEYQITEYEMIEKMKKSNDSFQTQVDETFGQSEKILKFQYNPPKPPEGHINPNKALYSQNRVINDIQSYRRVPREAERVLDANGLSNDFYLNLLDWSSRNVLAVGVGRIVFLWNGTTENVVSLCELPDNQPVTSVKWMDGGTHLAVGTTNGSVLLFDVIKQKQVRCMLGHSNRVGALAWNNHILSAGGADALITNHDVRVSNHLVNTWSSHVGEICGLEWSPNGQQLASGGNDNIVAVWRESTDAPIIQLNQHRAAVKALAWCPWQNNLLCTGGGTADRTLKFWSTSSRGVLLNSIDTGSQVCSVKWSQNTRELVSGHGFQQHQLIIWKYPKMTKVAELTGHTERVLHLALAPNGETLCSAGDQTLRFWKCFEKQAQQGKESQSSSILYAINER
eukprot:TRINITY_DN2912_c1_g1_i1.p1 TRINITY_DN2912_c1_g1~~TRINITY_DN2912_c1_g1_i1.p1  ORF type:complete len:414 (-),score=86.05 TRINITY_DN2912_c1_g1_i1:44-1285(-)